MTALTEGESLEALALSAAHNRGQELHLRILAWHSGNDHYRTPPNDRPAVDATRQERSIEAIDNLERLANLLSRRIPDQRLMKAEVMRELGHFTEAIELLKRRLPKDYTDAARFIRELANKKDAMVREMSPEGHDRCIYIGI